MSADPLSYLFDRLEVTEANEIRLDVAEPRGTRFFIARSASKLTYVDRQLAIRLRADGAVWCGDVSRDPCAVA